MGKVVEFQSWRKNTANGKPPRRKIGRDLLAVLIIGAGFGLGFAWMDANPSKAIAFFNSASTSVQEFVARASSPVEGDNFPVSSIGKLPFVVETEAEQARGRYFPVCGYDVATRDNCVVDGDTFHHGGNTIRISDIDAPETHPPRCAYEADLGERATERLSQLLSSGPFKLVRSDRDVDRYGRKLRIVIRDGRSIGKTLVSERLARRWTGKRRPWCRDDNSFG